uniref:Uncharacterized protein n=1 Tax=Nelumbo nucifera TaxID=4432 RepID=A0A822XPC7_NELNU|nr:TPA_asm: hypothetical protein HUJ06_023743 [Nelumbo nucifera]
MKETSATKEGKRANKLNKQTN